MCGVVGTLSYAICDFSLNNSYRSKTVSLFYKR